jgi:D-alanine-D-alanine ligase
MEDGLMIRSRFATRLRVCVLAGGQSAERAVSLASGRQVAESLAEAGHQVTCIDPIDCGSSVEPAHDVWTAPFQPMSLENIDWSGVDVVSIALHGGAGEDGRVQRFLEDRHIPFTGPGSASAELAMSKRATKRALSIAGVPTPDDAEFDSVTPFDLLVAQAAALGFPVVVKPEGQGSSLGLGLAHDLVELAACRDEVLLYDQRGMVESFIDGREFTVAILGRQTLPILEIHSGGSLFSYAAKYAPGEPHCQLVDDLLPSEADAICQIALATAEVLDTRGLVRVDLRLDAQGQPWILELNAIPGMTATSLAPLAAKGAGWTMPALCDHLVRECFDEFQRRESSAEKIAASA